MPDASISLTCESFSNKTMHTGKSNHLINRPAHCIFSRLRHLWIPLIAAAIFCLPHSASASGLRGESADSLFAPRWHVSTNLPAWGALIANATGEYDFKPHWSCALTIYYSAFNYFTSTRKFRTFILRPEIRWWARDSHTGFFAEAHLEMAAYNFALKSWEYRIQDVKGRNPALGGGIGAGYRYNFRRGGLPSRWSLECQLGVGVYHLKYNRFENRPGGQLVDTRSRTFFGIDNAAISLVYNFNPRPRR